MPAPAYTIRVWADHVTVSNPKSYVVPAGKRLILRNIVCGQANTPRYYGRLSLDGLGSYLYVGKEAEAPGYSATWEGRIAVYAGETLEFTAYAGDLWVYVTAYLLDE